MLVRSRPAKQKLIREHYANRRMGVPAPIMLYIGIRKGELIALTWNNLDLENATLSVNKSAWFDNNRVAVKGPKSKAI